MQKKTLTIVVPLHNDGKYIEKNLSSFLEQSFHCWRCILVDDGSTDDSPRLAQQVIQHDERFIFIRREDYTKIKGANVCRNIGMYKGGCTEHVMFVDADDYLHPDCLKKRMSIVEEMPERDMYVFQTALVDDNEQIVGQFYNPNKNIQDIIFRLVAHRIPWHTMSPVWSVDFLKKIGGWREEYERLQDVELNIRSLLYHPNILFADMPVDSYYRVGVMSKEKKSAALMGFCRLVKDYYLPLTTSTIIDQDYRVKIGEKFQEILEGLFSNYIRDEALRDKKWEQLYLSTLSALEIDDDDQKSVRHIFSRL